jgi:hypothetical protein
MNNREEFVVSRLEAVGQKLEALLASKKVPSLADEAYFEKCYDAVISVAPLHDVRLDWMHMRDTIGKARHARVLWLKGRDEALALSASVKESKRLAIERSKKLAEIRKLKAKLPQGLTSQGFKHVAGIPKAWQSTEVI